MVLTLTALLPCAALTDWFRRSEAESVYCTVRGGSLYKTDMFRPLRVKVRVYRMCVFYVNCVYIFHLFTVVITYNTV